MAFIPVPNTVRSTIEMRLHGTQVVNTLHSRFATPADVAGLTAVNAELQSWWQAAVAPFLSVDLLLTGITSTDISSLNGPSVQTPVAEISGQRLFPALPGNVALCVTFRSANRGRSARGRNYVPGLCETDVTGNTVTAAVGLGLASAYSQLPDLFGVGLGGAWVVASRYANGQPRAAGVTFEIISVDVRDLRVDSQRRRLN